MKFKDLNLNPRILRVLDEEGYQCLSHIQKLAIPLVSSGRDILACAPTGTGKTAAFSLPIINHLAKGLKKWRETSVLILCPTRELAQQTTAQINKYAKYLPIRCHTVCGGTDSKQQLKALSKGVQIIVSTPGRLVSYLKKRSIDVKKVEFFVIDEVDKMLEMGFIKDINNVLSFLPAQKRQNILFSATISKGVKITAKEILQNEKFIDASSSSPLNENINQIAISIKNSERTHFLCQLIESKKIDRIIIFTRRKTNADHLSSLLNQKGFTSRAFHSDLEQKERQETLKLFTEKSVNILVATDLASRGLHVKDLQYVCNFDMPNNAQDYIHRIGRTGRLGKEGVAFSFVDKKDEKLLESIEMQIKKKIKRQKDLN
ncbi:MAG: hypothetical protein CMP11_07495 [Zetaproteobacteria bacterium]|nr:hypothetical protein [Pseudobdellovibrionaceae bacterium]